MKYKITVWAMALLIIGLSLFNLIQQDKEYSISERRKLAQFPKVTVSAVLSGKFMTDFEQYTQDQFAGRDSLRGLKAAAEFYGLGKKDNNGLYMIDGYLSSLEYPLDEDSIEHAVKKFGAIYETYLDGHANQVFISVIPDKNYFMAEENGYLSMEYPEFFAAVEKQADFAKYIDISDLLSLNDYYKTDTHWKQECIVDVAGRLGLTMIGPEEAAGILSSNIMVSPYKEELFSDQFYGTYAGQFALGVEPDEIICLSNDILDNCQVYDYQNGVYRSVYDEELGNGKDPYEVYLSGDISLTTITNPEGSTGRKLVLFRDSFGSSIAPLLMEYYDEITLVDIRYILSNQIGNYIDFDGKDVLFLYSTLVLNNSETIK